MRKITTRKWWELLEVLEAREPFKTGGALSGSNILTTMGQLPESHGVTLLNMRVEKGISYVVYSYDTPIAWRLRDGSWTVPDVSYSRTTTRHQNLVRASVKVIETVGEREGA